MTNARGSLKWIAQAVNERWPSVEEPILAATGATSIAWRSPLAEDDFAEYRDADFLDRVDLGRLTTDLADWWPVRGPQWDALGVTDRSDVLLVEAKAHVAEFCSTGTAAGEQSRIKIEAALADCANALGAEAARAAWSDVFYQLANRLAHLHFLRGKGVPAWLVLVGFIGDREMEGPNCAEAWNAAYQVALHALGLRRRHAMTRFMIHVHPSVGGLA